VDGKIRKFFADKGFGFISTPDGPDHFFHIDDVINASKNDISIGRDVEFESNDTAKGKRATLITL